MTAVEKLITAFEDMCGYSGTELGNNARIEVANLQKNLYFAMDHWEFFAFARLGRIRNGMTPEDVEAVQSFLNAATPPAEEYP